MRERLPMRCEADAQGCVLVWHEFNGCMLYSWDRITHNRFITHWMVLPGRPEKS